MAYPTIRPTCRGIAGSGLLGPLVLIFLIELLARDLLLSHLGKLDHEVDDLFLVDRRTQARDRLRIIAVVFPHLLLLPGELARALDDGALHLFVSDLDLILVADFRDDEPEADAAFRDLAVIGFRGLLGGALIREGAALGFQVAFDRLPDVIELPRNEARP